MLYIDFGVGMADGLNGVGLRAVELATAMSDHTDVTVLVSDTPEAEILSVWPALRWASVREAAPVAGDVYWYGFATPPETIARFRAAQTLCVFDAIVWPLEFLTYENVRTAAVPPRAYQSHLADYLRRLRMADKFTVASIAERHVVIGMLSSAFWSPLSRMAPDLDSRFFVLPVGLSSRNENFSKLSEVAVNDELTLVWNGGTWNHYDPATAINAVLEARKDALKVHLQFLYPQRGMMTASLRAARAAADGSDAIRFAERPLGMRERVDVLRHATAAICAYQPHALWDLCPPMRLRETLLYQLPIIAPRRGALGDLIAEHHFGLAVQDTSPRHLVQAIRAVADPSERERMRKAAASLASDYLYESRSTAAWNWMTDGHIQ